MTKKETTHSCSCGDDGNGDCECNCRYTTVSDLESLPLIEDIAGMFPDEWLAFIISPEEDDDHFPSHGSLVAHSPSPDDIFDAMNAVLWNQCVYTYFNGDAEAMQASYGDTLEAEAQPVRQPNEAPPPPKIDPVPEKLFDLIHSALDQLYLNPPKIGEAIRRLRIARMRAGYNPGSPVLALIDRALDGLEVSEPDHQDVIWNLEDSLAEFETPTF